MIKGLEFSITKPSVTGKEPEFEFNYLNQWYKIYYVKFYLWTKLPQLFMSKLAVIFWLVITRMDPEGEIFKVRSGNWSGGIKSLKHQFLKCRCVGSRGLATKNNVCFDNMALLWTLRMSSIANAKHLRGYEASTPKVRGTLRVQWCYPLHGYICQNAIFTWALYKCGLEERGLCPCVFVYMPACMCLCPPGHGVVCALRPLLEWIACLSHLLGTTDFLNFQISHDPPSFLVWNLDLIPQLSVQESQRLLLSCLLQTPALMFNTKV